jgi:hypothetical protein
MIFGSRVEEMMARLFAALPPHSAVRLRLTAESLKSTGGYASDHEAEPHERTNRARKGEAFPHCAAAKPLSLIEWCIGKTGH